MEFHWNSICMEEMIQRLVFGQSHLTSKHKQTNNHSLWKTLLIERSTEVSFYSSQIFNDRNNWKSALISWQKQNGYQIYFRMCSGHTWFEPEFEL